MTTNQTHYCLGNGELKCNGCQRENTWQMLNQLPNPLRKSIQATMQRIDDTDCILQGRPWFIPSTSLIADGDTEGGDQS